ncbi:unnamed protein product [Aphanomyces euteiches]|uniref:Uncharacterized protein n=1 Tax=Aphanomyces euteiches TaxID=100861 RepID=A0A6G0XNA0_9STRA|nr:hypothetical protein Ae201684_003381 [Aphanomyces euteiches]KAH9098437.1 hypothetical protein Ae201684P_017649 [Aphanomyces euteiches]KAH9144071.1 hypothetical protein AeRB84_011967 [Aphanomyces euteiches]
MASLLAVKRKIWMFTVLSFFFFVISLAPIVLDTFTTANVPTAFCDSDQRQTMRNGLLASSWLQDCSSANDFVSTLLSDSVDVVNRPVQPLTTQGLNGFCTANCSSGLMNLKYYLFQPCDTVVDNTVRSIGSVASNLCPQGASVSTIPPAPTTADRAGSYCSYAVLDRLFGSNGAIPLSGDQCHVDARAVFFPTISMDGIPYTIITLDMVNKVCRPACTSLLTTIKNYTYPACDAIINDKTISLANLAARICVVEDVNSQNAPNATNATAAGNSSSTN